MIRPAILSAGLFCVAGLVAGWLSVPGEPERLAMLVRDQRFQEALERLDGLDPAVAAHPALLYEAFALNGRFGDPAVAEAALMAYLAKRPDDVATHRRAVAFLLARDNEAGVLAVLEHLAAVAPDAGTLDALTRRHRMAGRTSDELRVLLARTHFATVEVGGLAPGDEVRLGYLLVETGEAAASIGAFARAAGAPDVGHEARLALFVALVEAGRLDEASQRAASWIDRPESPRWDLGYFATGLVRWGASAPQILRLAPLDTPDGWRTLGDFVYAFTREGRHDLVRDAVGFWLASTDALPSDQLDRTVQAVVELAVERGLAGEVFAHMAAAVHARGRPAELASLGAAVYDRFGYAGVAPVRHLLDYEALAARPLFAARLSAQEGNSVAARQFLLDVELGGLSGRDALAWWGLAHEVLAYDELLALTVGRFREGTLPPDLVRPVITLAQARGRQDLLREVWASLREGEAASQ